MGQASTRGIGEGVERHHLARLLSATLGRPGVCVCRQDFSSSWQDVVSWSGKQAVERFLLRAKFAEISPHWKQAGLGECTLQPFIELLEQQHNSGGRYSAPDSLLDLVYSFRNRLSSDPRDGLYALLGLAPERTLRRLRPDYSKSAQDVYQEFLDVIIEENPAMMAQNYYLNAPAVFSNLESLVDMTSTLGIGPIHVLETGISAESTSLAESAQHAVSIAQYMVDNLASAGFEAIRNAGYRP
jgi:hypothetical protein